MHVPTSVGRTAFACWYTGVACSAGLCLEMLGVDQAVRKGTMTWARGVALGIGLRVRVHGDALRGLEGPCVFMSNHQSFLDILALFMGLPIQPGFLAKKELRRVPILGPAMQASGHVFIDRGGQKNAFQAIEEAAAQVRNGCSIVVFPEGTRAETEIIKPFKKGGFHLAKKAGVPIVPVGIRGTARLLGKDEVWVRPGEVEVHVGEPLAADYVTGHSSTVLSNEVRAQVSHLARMPCVPPLSSSRKKRTQTANGHG